MLDEPTGNLDPETAIRILDVIDARRARDGGRTATLLVTLPRSPRDAQTVC